MYPDLNAVFSLELLEALFVVEEFTILFSDYS